MIDALGYSSSGTMNTGKLRVSVIVLSSLANGSLSGPPRYEGPSVTGNKHGTALELGTPAGQIPAVADIELVIVDQRDVQPLRFQQVPDSPNASLAFGFLEIRRDAYFTIPPLILRARNMFTHFVLPLCRYAFIELPRLTPSFFKGVRTSAPRVLRSFTLAGYHNASSRFLLLILCGIIYISCCLGTSYTKMERTPCMEKAPSNTDFECLAALPEFSRFSTALIKLSGVAISLHSPTSEIHITYSSEIKNPLCRMIRASEKGVERCNACDSWNNKKAEVQGKPILYKCHAGFLDMIIPIFVQGCHVASLSSGQILSEPPSEAGFVKLKKRLAALNLDDRTLYKAYQSAPYMPNKKVRNIMTLLEIFAVQLCEDLRKIRELKSRLERDELRKAKEYVTRQFSDPDLGLEETAANAGLSPTHFSRVFKKCTGIPFTHYVQSVRLAEAKKLLAHSEKSISEICFACGFNSQANFIRVFRSLEQMTPSHFKLMIRKSSTPCQTP